MTLFKYILFLTALVLVGCNEAKNNPTAPASHKEREPGLQGGNDMVQISEAQFKSAKMKIGRLEEKPFAQTVQVNGVIDVPPQNMAVINSFSGGYIKDTPLLVGDKVKKGQRLVTIENPEFITMQQHYLETAEQLTYLKSEYERQKTMLEENITSQKNFLKAESAYKMALGQSNSLKKSLQMLNINPASVLNGTIVSQVTIYSPIDGYLTKVFVNTGSYVSPSDKIMEIMNTDHIHLELKVFEKDLLKIKKGQEILFKVPEASQQIFQGKVHLVGTTIDITSRVALIHGHINEKEDANFAAGMYVEAFIVTDTSTQLALPEDAVVELDGKSYVLLIDKADKDGYALHPLKVEIEQNYRGFTTFKTALPRDGKFLTKGAYVLLQNEEKGGH